MANKLMWRFLMANYLPCLLSFLLISSLPLLEADDSSNNNDIDNSDDIDNNDEDSGGYNGDDDDDDDEEHSDENDDYDDENDDEGDDDDLYSTNISKLVDQSRVRNIVMQNKTKWKWNKHKTQIR